MLLGRGQRHQIDRLHDDLVAALDRGPDGRAQDGADLVLLRLRESALDDSHHLQALDRPGLRHHLLDATPDLVLGVALRVAATVRLALRAHAAAVVLDGLPLAHHDAGRLVAGGRRRMGDVFVGDAHLFHVERGVDADHRAARADGLVQHQRGLAHERLLDVVLQVRRGTTARLTVDGSVRQGDAVFVDDRHVLGRDACDRGGDEALDARHLLGPQRLAGLERERHRGLGPGLVVLEQPLLWKCDVNARRLDLLQ